MTSNKKLISNTLANRMLSCIEEYELIKSKKSKIFKYVNFIEDARYNDIEDLKNELIGFLVYYNEHRPHFGIGNVAPIKMINKIG